MNIYYYFYSVIIILWLHLIRFLTKGQYMHYQRKHDISGLTSLSVNILGLHKHILYQTEQFDIYVYI